MGESAAPRTWHLVTGEYPPQPGGVADYTAVLARALADAGCEVHVWAPGSAGPVAEPGGVTVHRVAGRFGPLGLMRVGRGLNRFPRPRTVLVQYVPHAFGWKAMNLPFAAWVLARRLARRDDVRVMFHEVVFPWVRRPLKHNLIAAVNRVMAALLIRACTRAYVSAPAWEPRVRRLAAGRRLSVTWLPIPSTVPGDVPAEEAGTIRAGLIGGAVTRVVGHFGTYGSLITATLTPALRAVLDRRPDVAVLLLGAGGERFRSGLIAERPEWAARVLAPGSLPAGRVAAHLRACDLVVQPYPDGASTRRTTLMAALANGVPVVTTVGFLSEPLWADGPVPTAPAGDPGPLTELTLKLLDDPARLAEVGRAGRKLYEERFAIGRTVEALLVAAEPSQALTP